MYIHMQNTICMDATYHADGSEKEKKQNEETWVYDMCVLLNPTREYSRVGRYLPTDELCGWYHGIVELVYVK